MKLREIEIKDFRFFKHYSCQLASGVNVLIGLNGAGKTTLIHAIHKALSFIFSNDKSLGKEFLSQGNNNLNVRSFKESDYRFDHEMKEAVAEASIKAKAEYGNCLLEWELYRRNQANASLYPRYYKDAFTLFMKQWKEEGTPLPLLAYYSDSYPHKYVKTMRYALDIVNNGSIPRNFGYYQWDDEAACTSIWEIRMCNCLNRVQPYYAMKSRAIAHGDKDEEKRIDDVILEPLTEINFVLNRLKLFAAALPGIKGGKKEIDYFSPLQTPEGFQLLLLFKDGASMLLQDLPAGYRRLYSIVFDMAYRSFILNGGTEPEGIAIIDEIDLHLHPGLEKDVLNVFHKIFPRIQFVVSTHSPIVLTNLQPEGDDCRIMRMDSDENQPTVINDIYGLDYNTGVEDVMGVEARDIEIDNLLNSLAYFEKNNMGQQARNLKSLLLKKLRGDERHLNKLLEIRKKEMGDEIYR